MGCPHFHPAGTESVSGITQSLCQCDKYNTNPLRPIPPQGEQYCQSDGASGVNCWLDLRSCKKAEIAKRLYAYTIGDPYAGSPPIAVQADRDRFGRVFVCLQKDGQWVHEGDHEFPMSVIKG
jgi:hypothetical protein